MSKKGKQYSESFKSEVVVATLKGDQDTSEIATRVKIYPTMVSAWKRKLLKSAQDLFESKKSLANTSTSPVLTGFIIAK